MLSLARFSLDVQYTIRFTAAMVISVVCFFGLFGLAALAFWPFETHDRYGTWDVFAVRAMSNAERFDL